ncbi:MAG: hypothetical protein GY706_08480, partial [Bacteroides sp.]|nr:hypothetical protein [Bacteroides sp.]
LIMAFYDAIINQSAAYRNYQTEFDPFYGDILRLGIINDKLFATYAFMDLQYVYNYDPNIRTYTALYDSPGATSTKFLAQRVLDDMLGANYDTFPWFKYTATHVFAYATNTNLVGDVSLRERIAIRRFESREEFEEVYGPDAIDEATAIGNTNQSFMHNEEEHVYAYLADQNWHLV